MLDSRLLGTLVGAVSLAIVCEARAGDPAPQRRDCHAQGSRPALDGCADATKHVKMRRSADAPERSGDDGVTKKPSVSGRFFRPPPLLARRTKALLVQEIQGLEALLAKTRPESPDRPSLVRRIADDYSELAAIAEREMITAEIRAEAASDAPKSRRGSKPATVGRAKRGR